ncbi:Rv0361 family membrane protein [Symbioplanes lichenis]|uniref:Rv0361 family membrane protein n=1 Tax=Symbioplanes lichenis TaxID=1629072 RepID=UPI00273867EE|nr:hypothetical protein [Actinoplanes lichenis]
MTAPSFSPPPPGPGVQPPFPAPPVEGRGRRLGLGWGLGIGAVVLVGVVGLIALIGFGTVAQSAFNEQADKVVGEYLGAVRDGNYAEAYEGLCDSVRASVSESQFTERVQQQPKISSWRVGDINLTGDVTAPVDVTYADGTTDRLRAVLEQDTSTGGFEVCSIGE